MTNIFKKIYYWIIPKEYKQEAGDIQLYSINSNGQEEKIILPLPKKMDRKRRHK